MVGAAHPVKPDPSDDRNGGSPNRPTHVVKLDEMMLPEISFSLSDQPITNKRHPYGDHRNNQVLDDRLHTESLTHESDAPWRLRWPL